MIARWSLPALLLALALASAWLLHHLSGDGPREDADERHDPDLFMNDFVTTFMDEQGRPEQDLRARRMEHYPDTDTHELVLPHMRVFQDNANPVQVRSERGWLSADGDLALLQGRVYIWQDDLDGSREMEIITRDMRVFLDRDYVETEHPAVMRTESGESHSIGLRAYLDINRLELLQQVQTTYEPSKTQ